MVSVLLGIWCVWWLCRLYRKCRFFSVFRFGLSVGRWLRYVIYCDCFL